MQNQSPNQYSSCTAVKLWIHNMNEKLTQTCSGVWVWHISPSTWCHMTESCFRELLKSFRVISVRSRSERCVNARKAGAASISPERSARQKDVCPRTSLKTTERDAHKQTWLINGSRLIGMRSVWCEHTGIASHMEKVLVQHKNPTLSPRVYFMWQECIQTVVHNNISQHASLHEALECFESRGMRCESFNVFTAGCAWGTDSYTPHLAAAEVSLVAWQQLSSF